MKMIDQSTNLVLNVGNVIHDDVCLALSRVNFKELEDAPHSDRVDAAAAKIIAMIEQDVARRLLSDEAVEALVFNGNPNRDWIWEHHPERFKNAIEDGKGDMAEALASIGIDVDGQP